METPNDLPKFAVLQLSGCSGCEVSLLNSDEWISNFNLVYMPLVVSTHKLPEDIEVLLVSGGVRTDEDLHNLHKGASRSKKLIAVGTCALSGGVAQIPEGHISRESYLDSSHRLRLPSMLPRAYPLINLFMST
jgi:coenzyme F420-reducing hydrogenase gamma subunit